MTTTDFSDLLIKLKIFHRRDAEKNIFYFEVRIHLNIGVRIHAHRAYKFASAFKCLLLIIFFSAPQRLCGESP